MKLFFIINPAAGKTDQSKEIEARIETLLQGRQISYTIHTTTAPNDGEAAVSKAAAETPEDILFVACGGDGTLNEVVNGAAKHKNALVTHFPCGSGNDFVRVFGGEGKAFYDLESLLFAGEEKRLDLIESDGRFCLNIFSSGMDARIAFDMQKIKRWPFVSGSGAYILALLFNFFKPLARKCKVSVDGQALEGAFIILVAANGSHYGGGFQPLPEAKPDDGVLEFLLVKKLSRFVVAKVIGFYKQGRYREKMQYFQRFSGQSLHIAASSPITRNLDGEITFSKEISVKLSETKLRFWVPRFAKTAESGEIPGETAENS